MGAIVVNISNISNLQILYSNNIITDLLFMDRLQLIGNELNHYINDNDHDKLKLSLKNLQKGEIIQTNLNFIDKNFESVKLDTLITLKELDDVKLAVV